MNNLEEETSTASNNETTTKLTNTKTTTKSTHKCSVNCNCSASQKRPMNAFLIFCKRHRSVVKQKYSHLENRSITKLLGEMWSAIPLDQKQKYTELARQYKEAFMKANPNFKWYGSKWYKTSDITLPSNMRPSCSPPYVPFNNSSNTSNANNSNVSLNCNPFNSTSTNSQNESDNSIQPQQSTNGSNSTNQSDLGHISATNNDKLIDKNNTNCSSNLTPKPPKKRYLENGEFKEPTIQTTAISTASTATNNDYKMNNSSIAKKPIDQTSNSTNNSQGVNKQNSNYAIGGPPVLDIETMNRVIENAFSNSAFGAAINSTKEENSKKSSSFNKTNKMKNDSQQLKNLFSNSQLNSAANLSTTAKKSSLNKGDHEVKGDKSNDLRCNEKFNEPIEQQFEMKSTSLSSSQLTNSISGKTAKSINSQTKQEKSKDESRSNSQINNNAIDIFGNNSNRSPSTGCNFDMEKNRQYKKLIIDEDDEDDEDEDDDDEDKPLNLSSTHTVNVPKNQLKNQVLIDNLIDKLLSDNAEGNPMPIEMLQNSTNNFNTSSNSSTTTSSKSQQQNQQRKERSCKGKRYLEMLNENKLSKRSKNTSTSSICSNGEESNGSKNCLNNNSTSKWVSGSFDLEERIAALPQLGDSQLINVLDSTKTVNLAKSSYPSTDQQDLTTNNILLNNNEHNLKRDFQSSSSNQLDNKHNSSSSGHFMDTASTISKNQSNENLNENNRQIDNFNQLSNSSTDLAEKIVERLNSQNLNECDNGLVALAEIALQRESHHRISPSCT